jgi:hypothetical protein
MQEDNSVAPPVVQTTIADGEDSSRTVPTSTSSSLVGPGNGESPSLAVLRASRVVQTRIQQQQQKVWSHRGPIDDVIAPSSPGAPLGFLCVDFAAHNPLLSFWSFGSDLGCNSNNKFTR